jgi:hypothetical protein
LHYQKHGGETEGLISGGFFAAIGACSSKPVFS